MTAPEGLRLPAAVSRLSRSLETVSPWRALGVAVVLRALICGIWTVPSIDQWVAFAGDPYGPVELARDFRYITGSPLGPLVAHSVGADTELTYALVHLAFVALALATLVGLGRRAVGDRLTTVLVVAWFASPLSNVLLTWLGQPDPIVFGGLSAVALASALPRRSHRLAIAVAAALLVGLASPEQGLVAVAAMAALCWWEDRPGDREVVVAAVAALVVGRLGVTAFAAASDAPDVSRLTYIEDNGLGYFLRSLFDNLPAVLYSVFGAGWLLVGHAFGRARATFPNPWPVRVAALLVVAAVATTYDQTRVAALVSWPALVWLLRRADAEEGGIQPAITAVTAAAALVIPPIVIWEGEPYISSWFRIRGG